jgi:hypothetical protein
MCQFKSAIVLKDRIYCPLDTDSHEDMVEELGLEDNDCFPNFVRVEMVPSDNNIFNHDLANWRLYVDQDYLPEWFDAKAVEKEMRTKLLPEVFEKRFVIGREIDEITEGCWYLKDAKVRSLCGSGKVRMMCGSSIIEEMCDSSTIEKMYGLSTVDEMYDSSTIWWMYHSSKVRTMYGSSRVRVMYESSTVEEMFDSSTVEEMYDSSAIEGMYDSSTVVEMHDTSKVQMMYGSSTIEKMYGLSTVDEMYGSSIARSFRDNKLKLYVPKGSFNIVEVNEK